MIDICAILCIITGVALWTVCRSMICETRFFCREDMIQSIDGPVRAENAAMSYGSSSVPFSPSSDLQRNEEYRL